TAAPAETAIPSTVMRTPDARDVHRTSANELMPAIVTAIHTCHRARRAASVAAIAPVAPTARVTPLAVQPTGLTASASRQAPISGTALSRCAVIAVISP